MGKLDLELFHQYYAIIDLNKFLHLFEEVSFVLFQTFALETKPKFPWLDFVFCSVIGVC